MKHSEKHITALSAKCFFQLRQLRRIRRRSLDDDSVATLVHAFVVSRVDYLGLLAGTASRRKRRAGNGDYSHRNRRL